MKVEVIEPVFTEGTTDAGCVDGEDVRTSDLCAQWKAADAASIAASAAVAALQEAKRSSDIAERGLWWTGGAVAISFLTTIFTLIALGFGRKSAEAAVEALNVGRPYVQPTVTHLSLEILVERDETQTASGDAKVVWKNFGERPALKVHLQTELFVRDRATPVPIFQPRKRDLHWKSLGPSEMETVNDVPTMTVGDVDVKRFLAGKCDLYLMGLAMFEDRSAPGKIYLFRFALQAIRPTVKALQVGASNRIGVEFRDVSQRKPTPFIWMMYHKPLRDIITMMDFGKLRRMVRKGVLE